MKQVLITLAAVIVALLIGRFLGFPLILWFQKKPYWKKYYWDRMLTMTMMIFILGALAGIGYVITTPQVKEAFTEFYILGQKGKAVDYPRELKLGDESRVIIGIINHEGKEVGYRVKVVINDKDNAEVGPVVLAHGQKWEDEISFVPEAAGSNQRVEFFLYKNNGVEPYLEPLRLWVDVKE